MTLIRWEPFAGMDEMFNRFPSLFARWPRFGSNGEVSETAEEYLIRASLPAVKKDDVSVTVEDGMLTLSGERQQQEQQKDEKFHKIESFYGNFSRSFALPDTVDASAIRAESQDGILTIHVPKAKAEAKKLTTIKVQ
jgi:HSP20 family protein